MSHHQPHLNDLLDGLSAKKACDQCRKRKIKCDRTSPCSSCITAGHSCTTSVKSNGDQSRSKALIANQFDERMDLFDDRLKRIEDAILNLSSIVSSSLQNTSPQPLVQVTTTTVNGPRPGGDVGASGDYTLKEQTIHANDFLETAVAQGHVREFNPVVQEALMNLRQLVERQRRGSIFRDQRFPLQRAVPDGGLSNLSMPPLDVVKSLLNRITNDTVNIFTSNCALIGLSNLIILCETVYSGRGSSHAEFTIVNAALHYLFAEQSSSSPEQQEYRYFTKLLKGNLETCIGHFPLLMSPTIRNIQALLLSAFYSVDHCWPSIAWNLNSTAVRLCQEAGFHQLDSMCTDSEPDPNKTTLFWQAYILDKSLSLRLGRGSTIKDREITIPRQLTLKGGLQQDDGVTSLWLSISPLRAEVYEKLYSPDALAFPHARLLNNARELMVQCREIESGILEYRSRTTSQPTSLPYPPNLIPLFVTSSTVQFYVTATLASRALPAPEGSLSRICDECLDSARKAIECHLSVVETLGPDIYLRSMYVHWMLMLTPFAPFFVLFCHVIETLDMRDLGLIKGFASSLNSLRGVSDTSEKLFNICQAMCNVACAYQEDVWQDGQQLRTPEGLNAEFNAFLAPLGLGAQQEPVTNAAHGQIPEITDWFFGGQIILE